MTEDSDHAGPVRWYDYVLGFPFLMVSGAIDTSRVLRCKMRGHRLGKYQGYCIRCHRHID